MGWAAAAMMMMQGVETAKAASREAKDLKKQGAMAHRESERAADIRAGQIEEFEGVQRLQYLKSGVRLEGTPLQILAETRGKGAEEVSSMRQSGRARASLFRSKSKMVKRAGRAGLVGAAGSASASAPGSTTKKAPDKAPQ